MLQAVLPPHAGLTSLDITAVVAYFLITLWIAVQSSRRQGTTEEFFLAGRSMPAFAIGLSIMATLMSTISYLAVPGEVISHGLGWSIGMAHLPFSIVVVFGFWVPFFMRLRLTSAYEYLELRFNVVVRVIAASLFILLRLGWMGVVIYTSSLALETMIGAHNYSIPGLPGVQLSVLQICFLLVGLFTTIYSTIGGFRAVIWTDCMQSLVMFAGAIITIAYVALATGTGVSQWWTVAQQAHANQTIPPLFSLDLTERVTIITVLFQTFFWTICTHCSDQMVVQRYFSTVSLRSARNSYLISAFSDVAVGILLALSGMALLYFYSQHTAHLPAGLSLKEQGDRVFPFFIAHQLPSGLGGVILAALFAAAMSSVSSGINSVTAVTTSDLCDRLLPGGKQLASSMTLARVLSLLTGISVTCLAFVVAEVVQHANSASTPVAAASVPPAEADPMLTPMSTPATPPAAKSVPPKRSLNIIDLMNKSFNMFLGPLAALFLVGMFLPRCTGRSAIAGVTGGLLFTFIWSWWGELVPWLQTAGWTSLHSLALSIIPAGKVPTITLAIALPCVVTCLLSGLFSLILESSSEHPGLPYTWANVMKRPVDSERSSP